MRNTEYQVWSPRPSQLVTLDGDHLVTDSRIVAKVFGKSHSKVMRTALSLRKQTGDWGVANFGYASHVNEKNSQTFQHITMTKDGFMLLVMGFTGQEALTWKLKFIASFNAMADFFADSERNLWQKMQALIAKETASQVKATLGAQLMNGRKREIRPLRDEREELETAIQPSLLN